MDKKYENYENQKQKKNRFLNDRLNGFFYE